MKHQLGSHKLNKLAIKPRALSMPLITPIVVPPAPIHKVKKSKQNQPELIDEREDQLPMISLFGIKNQAEEQFNAKIKMIAERNLKKIEGKYDTIDKWKHKYVPNSSILLIRLKEKENQLIEDHLHSSEHQKQGDSPSQQSKQKNQKLLPIITKHPILQTIPDHHEQSKKLEQELMARLEKNKRYYKANNQVEKEINYFQEEQIPKNGEKRRQMELKKIISNSDHNKFSGMFHKKIILSQHFTDLKFIKDTLKKRQNYHQNIFKDNPEQEAPLTYTQVIKRSKSIHEFKENLLEQATHEVPEGWINNVAHESEDDLIQ